MLAGNPSHDHDPRALLMAPLDLSPPLCTHCGEFMARPGQCPQCAAGTARVLAFRTLAAIPRTDFRRYLSIETRYSHLRARHGTGRGKGLRTMLLSLLLLMRMADAEA